MPHWVPLEQLQISLSPLVTLTQKYGKIGSKILKLPFNTLYGWFYRLLILLGHGWSGLIIPDSDTMTREGQISLCTCSSCVWWVSAESSQPVLSINSRERAESIKVNLHQRAAAEQSVSRFSPSLPSLSPNIACLHNLWKWQGEEKRRQMFFKNSSADVERKFFVDVKCEIMRWFSAPAGRSVSSSRRAMHCLNTPRL